MNILISAGSASAVSSAAASSAGASASSVSSAAASAAGASSVLLPHPYSMEETMTAHNSTLTNFFFIFILLF